MILCSQLFLQSFSNLSSLCTQTSRTEFCFKNQFVYLFSPICLTTYHQQQKNYNFYFYQLQMLFGFSSTNDLIWVIYIMKCQIAFNKLRPGGECCVRNNLNLHTHVAQWAKIWKSLLFDILQTKLGYWQSSLRSSATSGFMDFWRGSQLFHFFGGIWAPSVPVRRYKLAL